MGECKNLGENVDDLDCSPVSVLGYAHIKLTTSKARARLRRPRGVYAHSVRRNPLVIAVITHRTIDGLKPWELSRFSGLA